jgi:hypothetical protein
LICLLYNGIDGMRSTSLMQQTRSISRIRNI